ncbi:MAG: Hpt domain-containing protein [Lachnospiraceae bacterium]|nr:Hpt domain-containing protein [Lachnospiraceae bacterium]
MTLEELYSSISGDYDYAKKVLRMDKMIDRFILKFAKDPSMQKLSAAYESGDATGIFEGAHSVKGVTANIGLTTLSSLTARISDEFRPGSSRKLSDEELDKIVKEAQALYDTTVKMIARYEAEKA